MTDEKTIKGLVRTSELFNLYLTTPLASTDVNAMKARLTSGWLEELRGNTITLVWGISLLRIVSNNIVIIVLGQNILTPQSFDC